MSSDDQRQPARSQTAPPTPLWPTMFILKNFLSWNGRKCEALLRPQVEASVLDEFDYQKIIQFSRLESRVPGLLGLLGIGAVSLYGARRINRNLLRVARSPKNKQAPPGQEMDSQSLVFSQWMMYIIAIDVAIELGWSSWERSNIKLAMELTDADAFARAVTNIRKELYPINPPSTGGWVLRRPSPPADDPSPATAAAPYLVAELPKNVKDPALLPTSSQEGDITSEIKLQTRSKWDELRAQHLEQGRESRWDSIREEKQKRELMNRSGQGDSGLGGEEVFTDKY